MRLRWNRWVLLLALAGMLLPASGLARGPQNVSRTIHNLSDSSKSPYVSDNEDQVCIFCHTPHGGTLSGPLWNRTLPVVSGSQGDLITGPFTHYNSVSLSTKVSGVYRPVSDISLLCLSCHDGSLAVNRVINTSVKGDPTINGEAETFMAYFAGVIAGLIGKSPQNDNDTTHRDLTDDHPISFSYSEVYADRPARLHTVSEALASGVRLFGSDDRVECSSCHDPHVNYDETLPSYPDASADEAYRPFLMIPNAQSALCLACHDK